MARFRYRYAAGQPPAPSVLLNLAHPTTGSAVGDVPALVDTGADQTVLPSSLIAALGLPQADQEVVKGFDGASQLLPTYIVRLQVRDLPSIEFEVIGTDKVGNVVLGRDVLNRYKLTLDGPGQVLEIAD